MFEGLVTDIRKNRAPSSFVMGERAIIEYDQPVVDFQFFVTKGYIDGPQGVKSSRNLKYTQALAVIHPTSVILSSLNGNQLMYVNLADELTDGDQIVGFTSPPTAEDPFIVILTKNGKLIIIHY